MNKKIYIYLFGLFERTSSCQSLTVVEIKNVVIVKVTLKLETLMLIITQFYIYHTLQRLKYLDRIQIDQHILKMSDEKEIRGHTLSTGNCIFKYKQFKPKSFIVT